MPALNGGPAPAASPAPVVAVVLVAALLAAVAGVIVALVTDDRDPTAILAWLLVIALVPVLGIVLYFFIGRNYRRVTPERERPRRRGRPTRRGRARTDLRGQRRLQRRRRSAVSTGTPAGKLVVMGRHVTGFPVLPADSVEVYYRGADKFARLLDDLAGAQRYIHLMYLIWEQGRAHRPGDRDPSRTARAGRRGARSSTTGSRRFRYSKAELKRLAAAGAEVKPCYKRIAQLNYRNHMKIALIDGVAVYTGGMNMGQEYIDGGRALRGVARHLAAPDRPRSWPSSRCCSPCLAVQQGRGRPAGARPVGRAAGRRRRPTRPSRSSTRASRRPSSRSATPTSSCCSAARERVWIQSPYFVPDEPLMTAMCAAALSGTDVRLMMTGVPDRSCRSTRPTPTTSSSSTRA